MPDIAHHVQHIENVVKIFDQYTSATTHGPCPVWDKMMITIMRWMNVVLLHLQVGCGLVDAGCRVMTGGLGGVMAAALRGAKSSLRYVAGDTIAVVPGTDTAAANPYADIVIATGLGHYRNGIVGRADGLVVVGGGAGTLQEIAVAWEVKRPIVVLQQVSGVGNLVGGHLIDSRGAAGRQPVQVAGNAAEAVHLVTSSMQHAGGL